MTASMIALLKQGLDNDPEAPMLIDAHPRQARVVTRRAFWRRVVTLKSELEAAGIAEGDCLGVWLPNWSDSLVWQFAAVALRAHVVGINTRYNVEELANVLDLGRPAVLAVAHDFVGLDLGGRLKEAMKAAAAAPPRVAVITGPHKPSAGAVEVSAYDVGAGAWVPALTQVAAADGADLQDDPDSLAVAFTTSGSTGRSKLAAHKVSGVASHALACATAGAWTTQSVTVHALPLTGVFSYVPAIATIAAGGQCLLEPSFDADAIVADMERFGASHVVGADDIVGRLMESIQKQPRDLARWKRLFMADFNGRSEQISKWAEETMGLRAAGVYGSSELFALTAIWRDDVDAPQRWRGGGMPVSAQIKARSGDPETGRPLPGGEVGELQFQGPNVVDAYLGEPQRMAAALTEDGWFKSGDLGSVRADGSFEYLCRIGDVLRLKGFLVEPAEIETRIGEHPAVEINKVVGVRCDNGDTQAIAFVVPRAGCELDCATLEAWCAAALARYKVPSAIHIIAEMPVTSGVNGTKIKAATLRQWARAPHLIPAIEYQTKELEP
ncbi:AMP-binding protein [Candidimonas nitroreducens]|uniref:Long-chain-fatty-acid--CoA ligase n=1 Tax=Candidimonas nitroreducens TaxID=683354 RepID=A0A225LZL4_9BURK|nr:AMP-binding protein [Candidimonas nitroreducens]OWT53932.1 acyl-CoA synthetase [Candidimonas nitroreducens]